MKEKQRNENKMAAAPMKQLFWKMGLLMIVFMVLQALYNVVKYRKYKSPVMSAAKAVNLAAALVSMLALEAAMPAQLSDEQDASGLNQAMTAATRGAFCIFILGMGTFMLINSTKQLKSFGLRYG